MTDLPISPPEPTQHDIARDLLDQAERAFSIVEQLTAASDSLAARQLPRIALDAYRALDDLVGELASIVDLTRSVRRVV